MRPSRLAALLLPLAALTAHAAPSYAAAPGPGVQTVSLLELATDDADDQAKALTNALKARVKASKDYSLTEGDQSLAVILIALKCGEVPDVACQAKIADKLKVDRYVWGVMRKSSANQVTADLHFWERNKPEVRQQFTYTSNLTEALDPALQKLAEQMVIKLTSYGKVGEVRFSGGPSGELFMDGASLGAYPPSDPSVVVPVGEHRFEVRAGGKVVAQGSGKVGPAVAAEVTLVGAAAAAPSAATGGGSWKPPAGYAAVGVGGALLVAGVVSSLQMNGLNNDGTYKAYHDATPKGHDVCDDARSGITRGGSSPADVASTCDKGPGLLTRQIIFYAAGAVLAGAGAYLLVSAPKGDASPATGAAQPRPLQILPQVGLKSGGLDVRLMF